MKEIKHNTGAGLGAGAQEEPPTASMLCRGWNAERESRIEAHGLDPRLKSRLEISKRQVVDRKSAVASRVPIGPVDESQSPMEIGFRFFKIGTGFRFIVCGQNELEFMLRSNARRQHRGGLSGRGIVVVAEEPTFEQERRYPVQWPVHAIHIVSSAVFGTNLHAPTVLVGNQTEYQTSADFSFKVLRAMNLSTETNRESRLIPRLPYAIARPKEQRKQRQ
jgi:hypothetical protein